MSISPYGSYLGVVISTGLTLLLDIQNNFNLVLKLEDHFSDISLKMKLYKGLFINILSIFKGISFINCENSYNNDQ